MNISCILPLPIESSRRTRQRGDSLKSMCEWTTGGCDEKVDQMTGAVMIYYYRTL